MLRWWLFNKWRQAVRKVEQLELWEVLRRRGTRQLANHNPEARAYAVERCTTCRHLPQCERDLLTIDWGTRLERFCPNTMYLRHLDAMRRHDPPSLTETP